MKIIDRYVIRNFLYSYLLCFLVMMGLRIVADLFINMDEFAKVRLPALQLIGFVAGYYGCNMLVYFAEMGGVILVAGAAFSLARMNQTNELVAVLASGMSLHRVIVPLVLVAVGLALVGVANQEVFIPSARELLLRRRDEPARGGLTVGLITDEQRSAWFSYFSRSLDAGAQNLVRPLILCRDDRLKLAAKLSGHTARYDGDGRWRLTDATVAVLDRQSRRAGGTSAFIWTPRSPEVLAAAGSGRVGADDGLRISFDRVDSDSGWLVRPRFDVLAPAGAAGERRVFGTLVAPLAWYGPAGDRDPESGYHLLGPPKLTAWEVVNWRALCAQLAAYGETDGGGVGARLWAALPQATRADIEQTAAATTSPSEAVKQRILEGLNTVIDGELLLRPGDAAALAVRLPPADRAAPAADPARITDLQRRRINRLALDVLGADAIIACQGELVVTSSLTPEDIALRRSSTWLDYLSAGEIGALLRAGRVNDPAAAMLAQHLRFAAPVSNVIMLLLALPFIISRERHVKSSAVLCVAVVGGFHLLVFLSRYMGIEIFTFIADRLVDYGFAAASPVWGPIFAAGLPILIFGPIAVGMLASMESMECPGDNRTLGQVLTTMDGRVNRGTFWFRGMLPVLSVCAVALMADALLIRKPGLITWAAIIAVAWPVMALLIKRAHDRGRPGTFLLMLLVPVIGWAWVMADLLALPGHAEVNTYGPPPAEG